MTCPDARAQFSALLDDALGADERRAVDAHVATCVDCRRELGLLRNTVSLLHSVRPARAPAGFVDRVRARVRPVPRHRRLLQALFLPWPVKLPLEAAAIVLVGVAVAFLYRETPELQEAARLEAPSPAVTEAPPLREPARPAAPAERAERAAKLAADETDVARRREPPRPAPLGERRAEPGGGAAQPQREAAKESARPDAAAALSALRATAADVSGRLVVQDREAAARTLTDLVAKAGGTEIARHVAADATVVELTIPRAAWPEFARELAGLGAFTTEREPVELPAEIRVGLRLTE